MVIYSRINTQLETHFNNGLNSTIKLGKPIKIIYLKHFNKT